MEFRQIRDFLAVYEEGGFTRAAARNNATQPGISVSIAALEAELGCTLFERVARGAKPTQAGSRFYRNALRIHEEMERAKSEMQILAGQISGTVTVGLPTMIFRGRLAPMLLEYSERFPAVELKLIDAGSSERLTNLILAGELDFALILQTYADMRVEVEPFYQSRLALVSGGRSIARSQQDIRIEDLEPLKLVMPSKGNAFRAFLDGIIQVNKVQSAQSIAVDGLNEMMEFLHISGWSTFLPMIAVYNELISDDFTAIPFKDSAFDFLYLVARSPSTPLSAAASAFLELLRKELKVIDRSLLQKYDLSKGLITREPDIQS